MSIGRIVIWGVVGGAVGAVIADLNSYDTTLASVGLGLSVGLVAGALVALAIRRRLRR